MSDDMLKKKESTHQYTYQYSLNIKSLKVLKHFTSVASAVQNKIRTHIAIRLTG